MEGLFELLSWPSAAEGHVSNLMSGISSGRIDSCSNAFIGSCTSNASHGCTNGHADRAADGAHYGPGCCTRAGTHACAEVVVAHFITALWIDDFCSTLTSLSYRFVPA